MMFAATRPERTRALILCGTYSFHAGGWDTMDRDPAELWARILPELGEDYMPSVEQIARIQEIGPAVPSGWGTGPTFSLAFPSAPVPSPPLPLSARLSA